MYWWWVLIVGVTEFLNNVKIASGLSDHTITIITILFAVIFVFIRVFDYIVNRFDTKDNKQFEMLYKIIDDENFLKRLGNQPFLIKQLFYKRFYLLKNYKVEEIEFLMSQKDMKINLYELSTLKSGSIIRFEDGNYIQSIDILTGYWSNNYSRFNIFIIIGFLSWILVAAAFFLVLLKSNALFYISITPLFGLEIYLLMKIDAVKAYLRTKNLIDDLVYQSVLFKNNQSNRDT